MFMTQPTFILIYILPSILISPIISLSINSWFIIWMTLEFNLMTFIPLMIYFNSKFKNISMKYFIIQSFSSSMFILSSNIQLINFYENNLFNIIMTLTMLIKLGTAPFHYWFINLMNNMQWMNCFILSTWQKIIPMILIMYLMNYKMIYMSTIISCLFGAIMGLNHQSLRMIFSYSSINHMGWMLLITLISENLWMLYFMNYMLINLSIMMIFNKFKIFYLNQIFYLNNKFNKNILLMNLISLSSIPPLFGFLMKWISIYFLNWNNNMIMIMIMIMLSILTFMFYMRIAMFILFQFNLSFKLSLIMKFKNKNLKLNNFLFMNSYYYLWLMSMWLM